MDPTSVIFLLTALLRSHPRVAAPKMCCISALYTVFYIVHIYTVLYIYESIYTLLPGFPPAAWSSHGVWCHFCPASCAHGVQALKACSDFSGGGDTSHTLLPHLTSAASGWLTRSGKGRARPETRRVVNPSLKRSPCGLDPAAFHTSSTSGFLCLVQVPL